MFVEGRVCVSRTADPCRKSIPCNKRLSESVVLNYLLVKLNHLIRSKNEIIKYVK